MKKLQAKHYIILLILCVVIMTAIVALTIGIDAAIGTLITGAGSVIGLSLGVLIRKKTSLGDELSKKSPRVHRQLTVFLIIGALLTMVGIVLLVLHLK